VIPKSPSRINVLAPYYGRIVYSGVLSRLLYAYEVRRIGRIHVNGALSFVHPFPHCTRLEHSIGASCLVRRLCLRLGLSEDERRLVEIAALLHDVGHPVLSFTTEKYLRIFHGMDHKDLTSKIINGEIDLRPNNNYKSVFEVLKDEGYDTKIISGIAVKRGRSDVPLYLQDMLNQPFDLDVLDTIMRWSSCGFTRVKINAFEMLRAYTIHDGRLVFDGRYLNDIRRIIIARRSLFFERSIWEIGEFESSHYMINRAIDIAIRNEVLDENFVFMDDYNFIRKLINYEATNKIINRLIMGYAYPLIFMKQIDEKIYWKIGKYIGEIESEIARKTNSKNIDVIIGIKHYHLTRELYPILINGTIKPIYEVVAEADEIDYGYFLFVYHVNSNRNYSKIAWKIIDNYI